MSWELKRTRQCKHCPWRVSSNPNDINGYSIEKHKALRSTIAEQGEFPIGIDLRIMACHETIDAHCVGWLHNQLGVGNNIALRMKMSSCNNVHKIRVLGDQHEKFEDTLP